MKQILLSEDMSGYFFGWFFLLLGKLSSRDKGLGLRKSFLSLNLMRFQGELSVWMQSYSEDRAHDALVGLPPVTLKPEDLRWKSLLGGGAHTRFSATAAIALGVC